MQTGHHSKESGQFWSEMTVWEVLSAGGLCEIVEESSIRTFQYEAELRDNAAKIAKEAASPKIEL